MVTQFTDEYIVGERPESQLSRRYFKVIKHYRSAHLMLTALVHHNSVKEGEGETHLVLMANVRDTPLIWGTPWCATTNLRPRDCCRCSDVPNKRISDHYADATMIIVSHESDYFDRCLQGFLNIT